jgi:hypothetical protein
MRKNRKKSKRKNRKNKKMGKQEHFNLGQIVYSSILRSNNIV